jgi:hypothetical protein
MLAAALRPGDCLHRQRYQGLSSRFSVSAQRIRLGTRAGTGIGAGFCGTRSCSSSFFKRPSIGLTFIWWNETRAMRWAHSIQHKQKTPSTVWEGPDS